MVAALATMETISTTMMTARGTATARAAMIRTTTTTAIATDQDDGDSGHYYECRPGGEMR